MAKRRPHLVVQHVERLSRKILEEHPEVVRGVRQGEAGLLCPLQESQPLLRRPGLQPALVR